jgi:hypothetical protein
MNSLTKIDDNASPFDTIRRVDDSGEFWSARELMTLMGYPRWAKFESPIIQAIENLELTGDKTPDHFLPLMVKSQGRNGSDYRLSRYACYMIALCCDGRKIEVASAKKYFAIKAREAEIIIPQQNDRIRELELQVQLAQAEAQKALAEKSVLDTRHLIVATCPEPMQQKILGFEVVKEIEYRDRIIQDNQIVNDGSTVNKTALCKRYGFMTKSGKPDYVKLNKHLESLKIPDYAWENVPSVRDNQELRRDYLGELDKMIMDDSRQLWFGE